MRYIFKISFYLSTILFFTFLAIFSPVCATEVTVFGPNQYIRTEGKPNIYTDTYTAPFPEIVNQGRLIIENGDEDGEHRVISALVFINGIQIFGPDDFKQQTYIMEAPLNLIGNNLLEVELRSKPDTYLNIRITQDIDPPTVNINADPDTIKLYETSILTWESILADSCVIEPDIGGVDMDGSITVSPDKTTTYTITAIGPGGFATDSVTITVLHPPSITIMEPDGIDDSADADFTIIWTDDDPDDNAAISLYYDTDNSGIDGTLIVNGLSEDLDDVGDQYLWDTTEIEDGDYYIYAVIDDGVNEPVVDYSEGAVTIDHSKILEVKITAIDGAPSDSFGFSVSISGDYVIVGAYGADGNVTDSGAAYIFKREGDNWNEVVKLTASDGALGDSFGFSVLIGGDYAIVGAPDDDDNGTNSGSAYIFKCEGDNWNEIQKITASDGSYGDNFGRSVSISGDYAIVGAPDDDYYGSLSTGSAYIFKREGEIWNEVIKIRARYGESGDWFGRSVSISGDCAIVGAPGDNYYEINSGAAYVFRFRNDVWRQTNKIKASDSGYNNWFGSSVSIKGDYAVIGAYGDDDNGSMSGSAYIFKKGSYDFYKIAKIKAFDGLPGDHFGWSVSIDGDYVIVGSDSDDDGGYDFGSAYVFRRDGSSWTQWMKLIARDGESFDRFGISISISGDYVIVGSYGDDDNGSASGSAYIYKIVNGAEVPSVNITADPASIQIGESSTLNWNSTNADSCFIDQGIGTVDSSGSITVSPTEKTTYTITATGAGGEIAIDTVTVTVTYPQPTVSISASPMTIMFGESSALTWNSTNAESCIIEPSIGDVDPSGTITVSPTTTTTYTITASNPGESATTSVTITVTYPQPTVSISANPDTIRIGESSKITWSSTNAVSCTIEPSIGIVVTNGSIRVFPTVTTTYTITATGPGGAATDNATITVTYPTPVVTISADPETINIGNSSVLTWTASYAVYVSIDHGIGPVDPNGSIAVSPTTTITYTITASNPMETVTESVTIMVIPFGITITSPLNNGLISRPDVMVEGTINYPLGSEVGVNVNGVVAQVEGDHFAANHVTLQEGANIITAIIVDTESNTASNSIAVYADTKQDYIRITADEESGVALFETPLRVEASFPFTQEPVIINPDPGVIVISRIDDEYNYYLTISSPGIYNITAGALHEGYIYSDTMAILVMDGTELDALLQAKWNGMRQRLAQNDIDGAVSYFTGYTKESYREMFNILSESLVQIEQELNDIQFIEMMQNSAIYDIKITRDGYDYSFYLLFVKDEDGLWKIRSF